ncbi:hypothetical protein ABT299_06115 [Spirillospora sp. NPDC000708]
MSLLAFAAALTPRTGLWTRRAGYALAAFTTIAVLDSGATLVDRSVSVTPYIAFVRPEPGTVLPAVLTIAMYCVREIATRRAADAHRMSDTEVSLP